MSPGSRVLVIVAAIMLSSVLGSIHAFSVFIPQWEILPGANRARVSLIYSIALIALTLAVLFGYRVYGKFAAHVIALLVGVVASVGLFLSAISDSLSLLYLTYGVLFGGANGLGYGYALQLAAQAASFGRGLAMALVTAFYAVGATVTPKFFIVLIGHGDNALALKTMAMIVLVVAVTAAAMLRQSGVQFHSEPISAGEPLAQPQVQIRLRLWIAYGCAVTAGLMVISHSYAIALWAMLSPGVAIWAATIVAFGNMLGGFSVGVVVDRLSSQQLLRWLPVLSTIGLVMMFWWSGQGALFVFVALALIGYSYGAIIAVCPVAVTDVFGIMASPRIYGQVFTAWGLAGLVGPWASGWLFDLTQSYSTALIMAAVLSGVSVLVIRSIEAR